MQTQKSALQWFMNGTRNGAMQTGVMRRTCGTSSKHSACMGVLSGNDRGSGENRRRCSSGISYVSIRTVSPNIRVKFHLIDLCGRMWQVKRLLQQLLYIERTLKPATTCHKQRREDYPFVWVWFSVKKPCGRMWQEKRLLQQLLYIETTKIPATSCHKDLGVPFPGFPGMISLDVMCSTSILTCTCFYHMRSGRTE